MFSFRNRNRSRYWWGLWLLRFNKLRILRIVYDFDRDANGNTRELHVDLALEAINYNKVETKKSILRKKVINEMCRLSLFYIP
jgi:hypothetical protein